MSRHMLLVLVIWLSTGLLIGCGGGSSSSNPSQPPPPAQSVISGIWSGTVTSTTLGQNSTVLGIISESREAVFITSDGSQLHGSLTVSGSQVSGSIKSYAPIGFFFPDGSSVTTTSISATAQTKSSISGTYTGGGDTGTFSLTYDTLYDRPSSLGLVSGTWLSSGGTVITVDQAGQFTGADSFGCLYNGQASAISSSHNAYKVNVTTSSCGTFDGAYDGLATLSDNIVLNDTLTVGVSNASFSIVAVFTLQ